MIKAVWVMWAVIFATAFAMETHEPVVTYETQAAAVQQLTLCAPDYLNYHDGLGRINRIHWDTLPSNKREMPDEKGIMRVLEGFWTKGNPDTVWMNPEYLNDVDVVAHEMLHVAIGKAGHQWTAFATCGLL